MGRIMSFDYGSKRTGIAISDPLQIIASPYKTCGSSNVINFVKNYLQDNKIDVFVVGFPIDLKSKPTNSTRLVKKFVELLKKTFPLIPVKMIDERYTSKIASKAILRRLRICRSNRRNCNRACKATLRRRVGKCTPS